MSSANVSQMGSLIDQGKISEVWLLYSCMFRDKSPEESNHLVVTMQGRRARIAAVRCHAKILALEMSNGDCLTIESSANLRSCGNLEQYMVANDRQLLQFHRDWIEDAIKDVEKTG